MATPKKQLDVKLKKQLHKIDQELVSQKDKQLCVKTNYAQDEEFVGNILFDGCAADPQFKKRALHKIIDPQFKKRSTNAMLSQKQGRSIAKKTDDGVKFGGGVISHYKKNKALKQYVSNRYKKGIGFDPMIGDDMRGDSNQAVDNDEHSNSNSKEEMSEDEEEMNDDDDIVETTEKSNRSMGKTE
eukprot:257673_1